MSETAAYKPRTVTRVRTLGDAVPVFRGFRDDSDDVKIVPKTADEMRADRDARRDAAPMSTSCGVDGCDFAYTGTAGECRTESAGHRAAVHPDLAGAGTHRKGIKFKRRGEEVDPARVAESRRLRQEKDDAARLETITRGRKARGEPDARPVLLEEVAADRVGPDGATSLSSPTTERSTMGTTCKIDGCGEDASDAPKAGPTSRLCPEHRAARSAEISAARTGRPRGGRVVKTVVGVPPAIAAPEPDDRSAPEPVSEDEAAGSLAALARDLEDARDRLGEAQTRYDAARDAFVNHHVIRSITETGGLAA